MVLPRGTEEGARALRRLQGAAIGARVVRRRPTNLAAVILPRGPPTAPSVRSVRPSAVGAVVDARTTPANGLRPVAAAVGKAARRLGAITTATAAARTARKVRLVAASPQAARVRPNPCAQRLEAALTFRPTSFRASTPVSSLVSAPGPSAIH